MPAPAPEGAAAASTWRPSASKAKATPKADAALRERRRILGLQHDGFNLLVLPIVAGLGLAGWLGYPEGGLISDFHFICFFGLYILFDFCWILLYPDCVPKAHLVQLHHVFCLILLAYGPLKYRDQTIGLYYNVLVEFNTIVLIARRLLKVKSAVGHFFVEALHWSTFVFFRFAVLPYTIFRTYKHLVETRVNAFDTAVIMVGHFILFGFNVMFLVSMLQRARKVQ